ncbi:MAG: ComF family protein [Chlorobiales bacterium]|nr:ComF family protein [Chlorobiales bacterium]
MLDEILHLFYPHVCAGCYTLLVDGEREICSKCTASFDRFSDADAADYAVKEVFRKTFPEDDLPQKAWALYRFHKNDRLQSIIHAMKYGGEHRLGKVFGRFLAELIQTGANAADRYDCIVPVPLHRLKAVERTYNQSEVIADSLAEFLGTDVRVDLVVRKKYTRSQTGLSPRERLGNVRDAFAATGKVMPENILLVDDVFTTGATVAAVMQSLRSAGVGNISLATIVFAA